MIAELARSWWLLALRGVAGILFGIGAFVWPGTTIAALVLLFGAYVLVDGVFALITGISMRGKLDRWWLIALEGLAGIILGELTFRSPDVTVLVLLSFIAAWSIITGVLAIAAAVQLRNVIANEWLMILSGSASIVFGILLIVLPSSGALAIVWLLGSYALLFGILTLMLAFRLRGMRDARGTHTISLA
jgi:uncharacterized membrane protein HdeD (DUF308 family)